MIYPPSQKLLEIYPAATGPTEIYGEDAYRLDVDYVVWDESAEAFIGTYRREWNNDTDVWTYVSPLSGTERPVDVAFWARLPIANVKKRNILEFN